MSEERGQQLLRLYPIPGFVPSLVTIETGIQGLEKASKTGPVEPLFRAAV